MKADKKFIAFLAILVVVLIPLISSLSGDNSEATVKNSKSIPKVGSSVTLTSDLLVFKTKDDMNKFSDFMKAKNTTGKSEMFADGSVKELKTGSKVSIVKSLTIATIQYNGVEWFTLGELIE